MTPVYPRRPSLPLFEPPARARRTDPSTSHIAAEEVTASGRAKAQRTICLYEVMKHPGQTAAELAEKSGLDRYMLNRRLPELREEKRLKENRYDKDMRRICAVQGTPCMTWWPVGGGN